jgi:hypothetical protein
MKRLMNAVDAMLDESLDGFAAAHAGIVEPGADRKFVRRRVLSAGKVALISGGAPAMNPCMQASSVTACWTQPAQAKFLLPQRLTRWQPRSRRSTPAQAHC